MKEFKINTKSVDETISLGKQIGEKCFENMVITLEGDLGAGKTTFTKGIALGMEISKIVKSPTFTIIREYNGKLPLYHMDVYRLIDGNDDLGFEQYFYGNGVTIIEWASIIKEYLPKERLDIIIRNINEVEREITLIPTSNKYQELCEVITCTH